MDFSRHKQGVNNLGVDNHASQRQKRQGVVLGGSVLVCHLGSSDLCLGWVITLKYKFSINAIGSSGETKISWLFSRSFRSLTCLLRQRATVNV